MKYDPGKNKIENWLDFGLETVKVIFYFLIIVPVVYFLWKCSF